MELSDQRLLHSLLLNTHTKAEKFEATKDFISFTSPPSGLHRASPKSSLAGAQGHQLPGLIY
jgi:hypothetical protein